ncbi:MAG: hypothetical protein MZV70_28445 [Desulfobacterales bacterium]|nr:hypothetical protein [Desulfobacterales bacterium]
MAVWSRSGVRSLLVLNEGARLAEPGGFTSKGLPERQDRPRPGRSRHRRDTGENGTFRADRPQSSRDALPPR